MWKVTAVAGAITALAVGPAIASASAASAVRQGPASAGRAGITHVLLISVDGLHQQDLTWYVRTHPHSVLAQLVRRGIEYSNARTPFPSDSFPGLVGQVTGGDPGVTGIYYDDTWNHAVFPAGTPTCAGPAPGGEVAYTEVDDINLNSIDAGQGLTGLPGTILHMTGNPLKVINSAAVPVSAVTCKPILPNQYCVVGQAPGLPGALRAVRPRRAGLLHAGDQQPGHRFSGRR